MKLYFGGACLTSLGLGIKPPDKAGADIVKEL
jgi:hypothetical protein